MNEYVAVIVDELSRLGVEDAVLSPGSRSTPLSMWFCEHLEFQTYLNIDERSAAFFALGIAKKKQRPVVLVCTSGSAAAHYLPAVIEAKYSRIPLIILTADRPAELQNVGAPQTIDQYKIFGEFLNYFEELSIPDNENRFVYPRIVIQKAFLKCTGLIAGPVQINIPLREPLVPVLNVDYFAAGRLPHKIKIETGQLRIDFNDSFFENKKGMIVCGAQACMKNPEKIIALGRRLKAPVLADPLSNMRQFEDEVIIDTYDSFLKNASAKEELSPSYILMFGQAPVSKRLQQFIALNKNAEFIQVDAADEYRNPSLTTTFFVQADPDIFADQIVYQNEEDSYLRSWQYWQNIMKSKLTAVKRERKIFEGRIVQLLQDVLPDGSCLVSANSMAIRDLDYFWRSRSKRIQILCNRGTNGIDGTISTALGIAANGQPTVLLTGDLAFFHDLNGFLVGKMHQLNLTVVLLNNNGGGIFQYLPQKGERHFDYLFTTQHDLQFNGLEVLYGIHYYRILDYADFEQKLCTSLTSQGIHVIEVYIDQEESWALHERYTTLNDYQN